MKILYIITNMEIGGGQRVLLDCASYLKNEGHSVSVLVLSPNPYNNFSNLIKSQKIEIYYTSISKNKAIRIIERYNSVKKVVGKLQPDIIHAHLDYYYSWLYALIHKKIIIATFHSQIYRINDIVFRFLYKELNNNNLIVPVCLTNSNKNEFASSLKIELNKINVVPNPIDLSKYSSKKKTLSQTIRFCYVARFHPIKNHVMLLRAFRILKGKVENCELILVGDGEERHSIENLAKQLGIADSVIFLGEVDNIPRLLENVDIGVISSISESFSLFLLECMAMGIPVVITRVGGMPEVLEDNGILVDNNDEVKFANAMEELVKSKEKRNYFAEKAMKKVKKYDLPNVVHMYEKIYETVMQL